MAAKSCKKRKIKQAKGAAAEPAVALPDEMPPAAVDNLSQPADLATDAASLARKKKKQVRGSGKTDATMLLHECRDHLLPNALQDRKETNPRRTCKSLLRTCSAIRRSQRRQRLTQRLSSAPSRQETMVMRVRCSLQEWYLMDPAWQIQRR